MPRDLKKLISEMTLEEKAGLCSGLNFWRTKPIERLGIPSIMMTDGPHGLRKQQEDDGDHLVIGDSVPATCFPSGAGLAASWNRELVEKVGEALGRECRAHGVSILLGPAMNIKRSPILRQKFRIFFRGSVFDRKNGRQPHSRRAKPGRRNGGQALCNEQSGTPADERRRHRR